MTSSECLEAMFDIMCEREHTNSDHSFWLKMYNQVKKDLDALEIIYNHRLDLWELETLFDRFPNTKDAMNYLNDILNTYDALEVEEVELLGNWIKAKEKEKYEL